VIAILTMIESFRATARANKFEKQINEGTKG
jgi:hypothetical protein